MRQFLRATRGKLNRQSLRFDSPLTRFGKRFAVRMDDFDRSIISASLTKEELKNAFKMMDENNDGTIDVRELARLFVYDPTACEKFISHVIDSVDVDNSGTLNFTEFLMLMVKTEGLEGVRHVFQSYDVDNSGKITSNEFAAWMRRHGRIIESEEIGLMIQAFDDDGDGEIDYNEFLLMVCRRILRDKATEVDINLEKPAKPERKSYFASRFFT
ncbi:Oidioi.mRNA.OKI2018_I69.PAR.g10277.t1.cds [Oikopleura dioica]|uniref:Oidioi.mRNA.OKI2018_I69.PAR.g10277.t1.cds n=1 Tax=Oikopleura dioica TaxID=34765 RepID=A0ABN7RTG1_OIKDI|nr:Oidioi.mRNA.OKI2018_I69.PAR.g10277.t1.cds [Oikopleura dioica]